MFSGKWYWAYTGPCLLFFVSFFFKHIPCLTCIAVSFVMLLSKGQVCLYLTLQRHVVPNTRGWEKQGEVEQRLPSFYNPCSHSMDPSPHLELQTHWGLSSSILLLNIWRNQAQGSQELDTSQTARPEQAEPECFSSPLRRLTLKWKQKPASIKSCFVSSLRTTTLDRFVSTPSWWSRQISPAVWH